VIHALWLAGIITVVVGSSYLLYDRVERPLLRLTSRWIKRLERSSALHVVPALAPKTIRTIKSDSSW
jgi:peptidoglycan/LPS O-acetylase OafA/YrhL